MGHVVLFLVALGAMFILPHALSVSNESMIVQFPSSQRGMSPESYTRLYAQSQPPPYSPDRLSRPGISCFHLNYEGPGGDNWDLDAVLRQARGRGLSGGVLAAYGGRPVRAHQRVFLLAP